MQQMRKMQQFQQENRQRLRVPFEVYYGGTTASATATAYPAYPHPPGNIYISNQNITGGTS